MTILNKINMEEAFRFELEMCKSIMDKKGECKFNGGSVCDKCGAIPLIMKMMDGVVDYRPVKQIFQKEVKKILRTDEYINLLKDLMKMSGTTNPTFFKLYYRSHQERLLKEGRNSKFYIIIEELLESNTSDLDDCIKIFFAKDILDDWDKHNVPFSIYLGSIKNEIDNHNVPFGIYLGNIENATDKENSL